MTQAEEEARRLVQDMLFADPTMSRRNAVKCALLCVDEKFKSINDVFGNNEISIKLMKLSQAYQQLTQVKKEIEKL